MQSCEMKNLLPFQLFDINDVSCHMLGSSMSRDCGSINFFHILLVGTNAPYWGAWGEGALSTLMQNVLHASKSLTPNTKG